MLFSNIHISKYSKINNIEINYAEIELEFKEEKEKLTLIVHNRLIIFFQK